MEAQVTLWGVSLALLSFVIGGVVTAAGFVAFIAKRDDRLRHVEKQVIFALSRTGNIYKKLGMSERYSEDLLRIVLSVPTPTSTEAIEE